MGLARRKCLWIWSRVSKVVSSYFSGLFHADHTLEPIRLWQVLVRSAAPTHNKERCLKLGSEKACWTQNVPGVLNVEATEDKVFDNCYSLWITKRCSSVWSRLSLHFHVLNLSWLKQEENILINHYQPVSSLFCLNIYHFFLSFPKMLFYCLEWQNWISRITLKKYTMCQ